MALHEMLILALVAAIAWGAVYDVMWFRIPNAVPIAILALYPAYLVAGGQGLAQLHWAIAIAVGTFLVGAFLFSRGWMGGGDVKLLTVLALWAGPTYFPLLLVTTSIAGGALALISLLPGRAAMISWVTQNLRIALALPNAPRSASGRRMLPYGVAVAFGGLVVCAQLKLSGVA